MAVTRVEGTLQGKGAVPGRGAFAAQISDVQAAAEDRLRMRRGRSWPLLGTSLAPKTTDWT